MEWIKQHRTTLAMALCFASGVAFIFQGWALVVPAAALIVQALLIFQSKTYYTPADNGYWYPPAEMIKELVPKLFIYLRENGCSKGDYQPDRHDCDDYTLAGMVAMHDLILGASKDITLAKNTAVAIFPWSFRRENGKGHRLFFVEDDAGNRHFIENYPVFDKYHDASGMYRILTKKEKVNGYIPS